MTSLFALSIFEADAFFFLLCTAVGWLFGLLTGMIPGIHVNNIAVLLSGTAAFLYGFGLSPVLLCAIILSCAVSHTFHNILPAIFLGAPGEETVFAVLPGHQLLLAGEGFSAVRLSVLGSAAAVFLSLPLLVPTALFLHRFYPMLETHMGFILIFISLIVLFSEKTLPGISGALFVFLTAGGLGLFAFEFESFLAPILPLSSASVLMPLLGGLFGVPPLILSLLSNFSLPDVEQKKCKMLPTSLFLRNAFLGTAAGAFVSWIPGVSSSVAAILAGFFKRDSPMKNGLIASESLSASDTVPAKEYIVAVSAINTANAVFGLLAFFVIGKSRNGAVVSMRDILSAAGIPLSENAVGLFFLFLSVILLSAFCSYFSTLHAGKVIPKFFQKINYRRISAFVLFLLCLLIFLMCGVYGLFFFAAAVFVGFLPVMLHVKKSNLMGVILFPVLLYFLGLR